MFNGGYRFKLFIAYSLSLAWIPECILCSSAQHYLASSVNWDEKVLRNDNSTQINMYKQMAWIHACTQIHMHMDLLKLSSEHGVTHWILNLFAHFFVFTHLRQFFISNPKCCQNASGINPPEEWIAHCWHGLIVQPCVSLKGLNEARWCA